MRSHRPPALVFCRSEERELEMAQNHYSPGISHSKGTDDPFRSSSMISLLKMANLHSYVKLPEGSLPNLDGVKSPFVW